MKARQSVIASITAICLGFSGLAVAGPDLGHGHHGPNDRPGHHHPMPPAHRPHFDHHHHGGYWRHGRWIAAGALITAGAIAAAAASNNTTYVTNTYDCSHVVRVRRHCHWNAWGDRVCRRVRVIENRC
jgi:hypothetical protein